MSEVKRKVKQKVKEGDRVWVGPYTLWKETEWGEFGSKLSEEWMGHLDDGMGEPIGIYSKVIPDVPGLAALAAVVAEVGADKVVDALNWSAVLCARDKAAACRRAAGRCAMGSEREAFMRSAADEWQSRADIATRLAAALEVK